MKLKEIEKYAEFFLRRCPHEKDLKLAVKCNEEECCLKCWSNSLKLAENKDKLEDEINI